ncbi:hypothetical protein BST96_05045 [Oceanicoccus sagamiensis]|uniref:Uncharacterized protein n=1 Tax=Oceanicoccus sagamiensis TaxID=716816 RepID=A0A1X9N8N9_9GAMM|nr:hypothetical protein BST96_05045 [Oceanicoccus sagamiensis]
MVACVQAPSQPAAEKPVVDVAAQREAKRHHLRVLLANAQKALAADRLMVPVTDNAYSWYRDVLAIDELNPEAHWGMKQITARYLQLAEQAFTSGRVDEAERMLQGAEKISATPQQIAALRERYRQQRSDNEVYLPVAALSQRGEAIQQRLSELAEQAKQSRSRLLIVARNDAEGRWIYQQMRNAVDGYRLRGNIEVGRVPRIAFIDL